MSVTSGQAILLPESTRKQRKERRVTLAINSRDRNLTQNYNSNNFRWTLRRPIKDILSVELVSGSIPADFYNVNTGWNRFTFAEGATVYQVALSPGRYTAAELAAELAVQLTALGGVNTYTTSYSGITRKMTLTATGGAPYTFYFATGNVADDIDTRTGSIVSINTPARLLGFEFGDYAGGATLTPPNPMDPDLFLNKAYLYINVDSGHELHRVELGAGRRDCFHVIYMDQVSGDYYFLNRDTYTPIFYSAPAPIARLSVLDISIRDEFFRLLDLGNKDYTLVFDITYLE